MQSPDQRSIEGRQQILLSKFSFRQERAITAVDESIVWSMPIVCISITRCDAVPIESAHLSPGSCCPHEQTHSLHCESRIPAGRFLVRW